jgi:KDO2-lipid IV(A) lauroyltransferase
MGRRKKIKRNLEVVAAKGLKGIACSLPRSTGLHVFSALGGVAGHLLRQDRRRAIDNLGIAFPDMPPSFRRAMTGAMFKSLGRNAYEFLTLEGSTRARLRDIVERVEGLEHMDAARARNQGVIGITGHIGCWELLAAYFTTEGYPVNVVGRQLWESRLDRELVKMRTSVGYRTIDRDRGAREMLRVLRENRILAVLIDQHTRVSGVYVPFFNRPAHTPTGVAKLALATGATILPMAIYMTRPGRHLIRILPAIEYAAGSESEADIEKVTERCSRAIEELIRFDPKQWVWFHRRWRDGGETKASYARSG